MLLEQILHSQKLIVQSCLDVFTCEGCLSWRLVSLEYCFGRTMANPEKLCFQWDDFKQNISAAFGDLKGDNEFTDVTLACDDGQRVEAQRVILSASSPFFPLPCWGTEAERAHQGTKWDCKRSRDQKINKIPRSFCPEGKVPESHLPIQLVSCVSLVSP